jgi:thioredoxin 2
MADTYLIQCPHCGTTNRVPASSEGKAGKCGDCHVLLLPLYSKPVMLTDRNFDDFVKSYRGPVLAEFWASWCPHCRNFAQVVQEVAGEMAGRGAVVQVNTEENPQLAGRFHIRGVPTVMALRGGRVTGSESGAMDRHSLLAWWQQHLGKNTV